MKRIFFTYDGYLRMVWWLLAVISFVTVIFGLVLWGANAMQAKSCRDRAELYGLEMVDYGFWTGCAVRVENGVITDIDTAITLRGGTP